MFCATSSVFMADHLRSRLGSAVRTQAPHVVGCPGAVLAGSPSDPTATEISQNNSQHSRTHARPARGGDGPGQWSKMMREQGSKACALPTASVTSYSELVECMVNHNLSSKTSILIIRTLGWITQRRTETVYPSTCQRCVVPIAVPIAAV